MINLFDNYTEREQDLEYSLYQSGYSHLSVVLEENGFLPSHVVSPIGFFTGMDLHKKSITKRGRFFNELSLPSHWEIQGSGVSASIFEGYKKRGAIHYSNRPGDYRLIQSVEWFNDFGKTRSIDLYNQNGYCFGRKTYSDGAHVLSSYFDTTGREIILMNHVAQTIQVLYKQKKYIFSNYYQFIVFYFEAAQLPISSIFYNSLGRPFFITRKLKEQHPQVTYSHHLFWQEISQTLPGNMRLILEDPESSTTQIIVQNKEEYQRLVGQVHTPSSVSMDYLGYLYDFKRQELRARRILVHTNSDQVEALEELIRLLPDFHFSISARTEMSTKLTRLEGFGNVTLYPNITTEELGDLVKAQSFYLDINRGGELDNIVRVVFDHNLLILGFEQTLHNRRFVSPKYIFDQRDYSELVVLLEQLAGSSLTYTQALNEQHEHAGQTRVEKYKEVIR